MYFNLLIQPWHHALRRFEDADFLGELRKPEGEREIKCALLLLPLPPLPPLPLPPLPLPLLQGEARTGRLFFLFYFFF